MFVEHQKKNKRNAEKNKHDNESRKKEERERERERERISGEENTWEKQPRTSVLKLIRNSQERNKNAFDFLHNFVISWDKKVEERKIIIQRLLFYNIIRKKLYNDAISIKTITISKFIKENKFINFYDNYFKNYINNEIERKCKLHYH